MPTVDVSLGARSYPIIVEPGILSRGASHVLAQVPSPSSVVLLTHPALEPLYAAPLARQFAEAGLPTRVIAIPSGERHKNLRTVARLYDRLVDAGTDRRSLLVAVGGGVLGDVTGFVAATFLRGIAFVQVPTTLLAQVDASVGGKTGVDLPSGKNLVGAFNQPRVVLIDVDTLRTLPARELRSGMAEVVKHGIISDEHYLARTVDAMPRLLRREPQALCDAVLRSCEIKAAVVGQDETEQGRRAILNFGHTVGHALEVLTGYRTLKHGEAVAIGMVSAALLAEELGVTGADTTAAIRQASQAAGLPTALPAGVPTAAILDALSRDKKTVGGRLTFVLVERVGAATVRTDVPPDAVERALRRHQAEPATIQPCVQPRNRPARATVP